MNRTLLLLLTLTFLFLSSTFAQQNFTRVSTITTSLYEEGGFGNIVAGVDWDGDGMPEIYACNTNMVDRPLEVVPRLYKFEWNGTDWAMVWMTESDIPLQNTWPGMTWGDLDGDGRPEIIWGPVNYLDASINPNPSRILVYEYPGDGSDNMGVDDGFGGFEPNARWSIINTSMTELRPIKFIVSDTDDDLQQEIIFCDRRASASGFHYGVVSVSDVPNNGGGTEVWTLEGSGIGDTMLTASANKWDIADMGGELLLFAEGNIFIISYDNGVWSATEKLVGVNDGKASFKGSVKYDVNNNGSPDLVVGSWFAGAKVYLITKDNGPLQYFEIADLSTLGGVRLLGGAAGDLDNDGLVDFVFGSRHDAGNSVNNPVFRVEYQGGDFTLASSYQISVIDSLLLPLGGDLDVIVMANVDGDPADEVIYTQGYTRGNPTDSPGDIVILDLQHTPVSVKLDSDLIPQNFYLDQNFPNPFNPSTKIKFGIIEASQVDLRVYDALGREVAVLVSNQHLAGGSYSIKFDARELASGIYIYRLRAGDAVTSKKMQLLK